MGLDTSHGCWHGTYSSFNDFRRKLAKEIGINLNEYSGYNAYSAKRLEDIDHGVIPLLNHSDCEGILTVAECHRIVTGLDDILSKVEARLYNPAQPFPSDEEIKKNCFLSEDHYFCYNILKFKRGCELAIKNNECVEFS